MNTVIVSSTAPYAGKSGLALALLGTLAARGLKTAYFKPYGTMPTDVDGEHTDADALYISRAIGQDHALSDVCPIVATRSLIEDVLRGELTDSAAVVREAFERVSKGADIVVVEGGSDLSQGRSLSINLCELASLLDAKVILVDRPDGRELPDSILWAADCLGESLLGVIFNAVHESVFDLVSGDYSSYLQACGVTVLGTIGRDALLSSVSVQEIADTLGATVLSAEGQMEQRAESFMVGAMGQDKALRFFRRRSHKAVITGGDRADVQLAALETDTTCIILTGNLPPASLVLSRAEELGVPMLLVGMDTLSAVEKMETLFGRARLHDPAKADRIRQVFADAVDIESLTERILE